MTKENKKTILIVEDDKPIIKSLSLKLKESGFHIFEAEDGEKGLQLAIEKKPDLILLDIIMPIMDGVTMLKKLRGIGKDFEKIKVLVLTNLIDDEKMAELMELGSSAYLVKTDWNIKDLVKRVEDILE